MEYHPQKHLGSIFRREHWNVGEMVYLPYIFMCLSGLVILWLAVRWSGRRDASGGVSFDITWCSAVLVAQCNFGRSLEFSALSVQSVNCAIRHPPTQTTSKAFDAGYCPTDCSICMQCGHVSQSIQKAVNSFCRSYAVQFDINPRSRKDAALH